MSLTDKWIDDVGSALFVVVERYLGGSDPRSEKLIVGGTSFTAKKKR